MNLTSVQRLRLVGNLVELDENCAEKDIAIAQMLKNQEYSKEERKEDTGSGHGF